MIISVNNLGAIRQAELKFGKLTVICGSNNTGKTYVTYAIYGFLDFWNKYFAPEIDEAYIDKLLNKGVVSIDINQFAKNAQKIVNSACEEYNKYLPIVLAAQKKLFESTKFKINLDEHDVQISYEFFENSLKPNKSKADILTLRKEKDSNELIITLFQESGSESEVPVYVLQRAIGNALKVIVFGKLFPVPFIASAERTGAAIFRKELDLARNNLLKRISKNDEKIDPFELLQELSSKYALPVEDNLEFTRKLESLSKDLSFIAENHSELLSDFSNIIGGEFHVSRNDDLYFIPKSSKQLKLSMDESSSSVRSMLDVGFYIRHVAKKGDLLMIDEPELNLHPENQRKVARLIARLINCGINVFITTHSDYIIKELNTIIMMNSEKPHIQKIVKQEKYLKDELLNIDDIQVYIAKEVLAKVETRSSKCNTLVPADINREQGIEIISFDQTIDEMNRIQDAILFGG